MTTRGNTRNEDKRGTEDKQANRSNPKKGNSVKRNKNREAPGEQETTDDEGNIT